MLSIFTALAACEKTPEAAAAKGAQAWIRQANIRNIRDTESDELHKRLATLATVIESDGGIKLQEVQLDAGVNGLTYAKGPKVSFAEIREEGASDIHCYFKGDLTQKRINEIHIDRHLHDEDDCHKIVHMYASICAVQNVVATEDFVLHSLLDHELKHLHGPFVFVLYDAYHKRVVAARDPDGKEPLFWATKRSGNKLSIMFSTERLALFETPETISEFPAGGLYISHPGELCGTLNGAPFSAVTTKDPKQKKDVANKAPTKPPELGKGVVSSRSVPLGGGLPIGEKPKPRNPAATKVLDSGGRFGNSDVPNTHAKEFPKGRTEPPAPLEKPSPFDSSSISRTRRLLY